MSRPIRLLSLLLISTCLIFTACSKKEKASEYEHLQYIPANTPYVFVNLKPLPEDLQEKFSESYEEIISVYSRIAKSAYADYVEKAEADSEIGVEIDDEDIWDNKWIKAIQKEFSDGFSLETLENYGIDKKSTYSLYGHGVLPVLRLRLTDPKLFSKGIERIESYAEDEIPELTVDGMQVWAIGDTESDIEKGELIIALSDKDLIVTLLPPESTTAMLEQLIGHTKPKDALSSTDKINNLMSQKKYLPESLGYIDFQQILNRFTQEPTGLDKEFLAQFDEFNDARNELSDVCKAELQKVVQTVPRLVYGLTEISSKKILTESVFEVRSDLAKEMTKLSAPVPGLGDGSGFFSMGFSMDIPAMRDFAIRRIEALKANPYECEFLKMEPANLDKALAGVKNPAAGFVESVHGFNLVIDEIDADAMFAIMKAKEETSGDLDFSEIQEMLSKKFSAYVVFAADKPKTMINMGKMMSPELAALNIKDDGKPVLINELFPNPIPMDVFAAMNNKALTISVGKDAESKSKKIFALKAAKNPPLFAYSVDMGMYMKLINKILDNPELADAMSEDEELTIEEMRALFKAFGNMFGVINTKFVLREDGVAVEQSMEF